MRALLVCLMAFFLAGCGVQHSIRHLPSQQWKSEQSQTIQMRYLSFDYRVKAEEHTVVVSAEAYPVITALPEWASWYGEILLTVYVADSYGRVIAESDIPLDPRPLQREGVLPLTARFDLGTGREQPLFISFGYALSFSELSPELRAEGGQGTPPRQLRVSEIALDE